MPLHQSHAFKLLWPKENAIVVPHSPNVPLESPLARNTLDSAGIRSAFTCPRTTSPPIFSWVPVTHMHPRTTQAANTTVCSWWHLEGPYQQLMTDKLGWWDRQMTRARSRGNKDSLRWAKLLQSMQHVQDKARTRVLPHSNTLNTRQRHLSEEPQC